MMAAGTIDDLARALGSGGVDAAAWRRWVASEGTEATFLRELLSATEALVRGALDQAGYEARIASLWSRWRARLDAPPPEEILGSEDSPGPGGGPRPDGTQRGPGG